MALTEVLESEEKVYDAFVAAQDSGSFLQSREWGNWQTKLGRQIFRYWILDGAGGRAAAVQLTKTPLPFGKYYLYAPYGPVFAEAENFKFQISNFKTIFDELKSKFQEAVFIRIEPQKYFEGLEKLAVKSINIQPAITMVLDINKEDGILLASMHHKTRYNIRLALRHGIEIQNELVVTPGYGLYTREALDVILQTQTRQHYRGHSEGYYKNLIDFFSLHNNSGDLKLRIYKALYNKELLASAIMVDFGSTRMYLYGGSSEKYRNLMAPYLLHWQAIVDAREIGLKYYDFGGSEVAAGGERGFTRFKEGFGGRVVSYAGAYDIINHQVFYKFYSVVRKLNRVIR